MTQRQKQILDLLIERKTGYEICNELRLTPTTLRQYIWNMLRVAKCKDSAQLIQKHKAGLL